MLGGGWSPRKRPSHSTAHANANLQILLYIDPESILKSRVFVAGVGVNGTLGGCILLILPDKLFYVSFSMNNKNQRNDMIMSWNKRYSSQILQISLKNTRI